MPIALVMILGLAVAADGARADNGATDLEATRHGSAEVLEHVDRPDSGRGWLAFHLDRIELHKKKGFAYTRGIDVGERGIAFSIGGPALGFKKHLGLSLEIRF